MAVCSVDSLLLHRMRVEKLLLGGDSRGIAESIASELGIEYFAELLPEDKVRVIEEIKAKEKALLLLEMASTMPQL
ncbi:predicted coding region AF_0192 [Archaeoglobus fulgidus DSM 4304]|uniref:Uncharacterized protein n=1 Tax=Archaeoglobus fulgidus (strain ATCC 49558 / DSM 4304 / JCM 9628 / NBRC 100126 / VC-16) TaxID=224325 RepID=O30046_ARCFU|nr:predicted coding region AF_0192 [Archaeoglobus fulgidus DSM 4304]